jgi:hypothetical protein
MSRPNLGLRAGGRRGTASRMNFGKIAFGALIIAVGVVLLAVRTGFAPSDTPLFLVRYWPVLLIAFGLALLAGAIKNPFLGCLSVILILGGLVVGLYWAKRHHEQRKDEAVVSLVDLDRVKVESLSMVVRTLAGRFHVASGPPPRKQIAVRVRSFTADSTVRFRFHVAGTKGVFEWPLRNPVFGLPTPGMGLDVRIPETLPVSIGWRGWLASVHADLTGLRPAKCALNGTASSILLGIRGSTRPEEIEIRGFASDVKIRIQGDCPVRLVSRAPMVMTSLPPDFMEHAPGRGRDRTFTGEGKGSPLRVLVDGPLIRIKIERVPVGAASTVEDGEWPRIDSASRSRSRSS